MIVSVYDCIWVCVCVCWSVCVCVSCHVSVCVCVCICMCGRSWRGRYDFFAGPVSSRALLLKRISFHSNGPWAKHLSIKALYDTYSHGALMPRPNRENNQRYLSQTFGTNPVNPQTPSWMWNDRSSPDSKRFSAAPPCGDSGELRARTRCSEWAGVGFLSHWWWLRIWVMRLLECGARSLMVVTRRDRWTKLTHVNIDPRMHPPT